MEESRAEKNEGRIRQCASGPDKIRSTKNEDGEEENREKEEKDVTARSVPAPSLLLGRLARRVTGIACGLLLGEQRLMFLQFLGLERRHQGGFLSGFARGLLGSDAGLFGL